MRSDRASNSQLQVLTTTTVLLGGLFKVTFLELMRRIGIVDVCGKIIVSVDVCGTRSLLIFVLNIVGERVFILAVELKVK